MKILRYITILLFSISVGLSTEVYAANAKKPIAKTKKNTVDTTAKKPQLSKYQKLFDKKTYASDSGLIKLHKIEGKVLLEIPRSLNNTPLLLTSAVESVSDMSMGYAGQQISNCFPVYFAQTDSTIQLRLINARVRGDEESIKNAINKNNLSAVIFSSPIVAISPDSSAVIDATNFFISDSRYIGSFSFSFGMVSMISQFKKELSSVNSVNAYGDGFSVLSDLSYGFLGAMMFGTFDSGIAITSTVKTSLTLLPSNEMTPRIADFRIGTGFTPYTKISGQGQKITTDYFANRWRIEPSDPDKFAKGELVEPKKQIVFYCDTLLPKTWAKAFKKGILEWNKAFEKIGYKNVLAVMDYPTADQDPLFSSSNTSYNCVKYSQMPMRGISTRINRDPRTGEILSTSIQLFKDVPITISRSAMTQIGSAEPRVISYMMPDDLLCEALTAEAMRTTGLCLGLTPNMASMQCCPIDSLRSPTYTRSEGFYSSVTHPDIYNFAVRNGDKEKGVKLSKDQLGPYDYYVVDWLYGQIPGAENPEQEVQALKAKIESKKGDPRFAYGKEPIQTAFIDPRNQIAALGNDYIKSAEAGMENLEYMCQNAAPIFKDRNVDDAYRELFLDFALLRLADLIYPVMRNVGGIYINEKYAGDQNPTATVVPKKLQRESLMYMMKTIDNAKRFDNKDLLKETGVNYSFSNSIETNFSRVPLFRLPQVAYCASIAPQGEKYTVTEMFNDIKDYTLRDIKRGVMPTQASISILQSLVGTMIYNSALPNVVAKYSRQMGIAAAQDNHSFIAEIYARCYPNDQVIDPYAMKNEEVEAFGNFNIPYQVIPNIAPECTMAMKNIRNELVAAKAKTTNAELRVTLELMIVEIDKAFGK